MSQLKKYRFVKKHEDAEIFFPITRKVLNKHTATDEDIDLLLSKFPKKYDHNFELVSGESSGLEDVEKTYPSDEPNEGWTVDQLKSYAKDHDIDLGRAKKEAAILKKIAEHNG